MTGVLGELLLARQPILDADVEVVGYQLLHRDIEVPRPVTPRSTTASLVVDGLLTLGRRELTGGADAWVTVPDELVRGGTLLDLPSDGIVLGLPGDTVPDAALRRALVEHADAGFRLCLDEVVVGDARLELLELVDHARVDLNTEGPTGLPLIGELAARGSQVVAAGVASYDQLERTLAVGASLVQGLFWTRPRDVRALRPVQFAPGHLQLLDELSRHEVDLHAVEDLIRSDITLTDRFLRLIRRVVGYRKVASIHDGLVLLGVRAVQRWVSLLTLGRLAEEAPIELITLASARARSCELLEEMRGGDRRLEAFSLGMFSVLGDDGRLSAATLDVLPVSEDVREALEHGRGTLRPLLDVELAAEQAAWQDAEAGGRAIGVEPVQLAQAKATALTWSAAVCA